ncbi:hypothetical protein R1sor_000026 [Riccia sorocarpa]|uniref:Uncharacterized protein n=1 Tax=Riccia sorocarpa TaxID=122646 RepID=A0ABD3GUE9_9MARC
MVTDLKGSDEWALWLTRNTNCFTRENWHTRKTDSVLWYQFDLYIKLNGENRWELRDRRRGRSLKGIDNAGVISVPKLASWQSEKGGIHREDAELVVEDEAKKQSTPRSAKQNKDMWDARVKDVCGSWSSQIGILRGPEEEEYDKKLARKKREETAEEADVPKNETAAAEIEAQVNKVDTTIPDMEEHSTGMDNSAPKEDARLRKRPWKETVEHVETV